MLAMSLSRVLLRNWFALSVERSDGVGGVRVELHPPSLLLAADSALPVGEEGKGYKGDVGEIGGVMVETDAGVPVGVAEDGETGEETTQAGSGW